MSKPDLSYTYILNQELVRLIGFGYLKDLHFDQKKPFVDVHLIAKKLNIPPPTPSSNNYFIANNEYDVHLPETVAHEFFYYESGVFERINDYYENTMSESNRRAIDLIFSTLKEKGVAISDEGFIDTNGHEEHTICFDFVNN